MVVVVVVVLNQHRHHHHHLPAIPLLALQPHHRLVERVVLHRMEGMMIVAMMQKIRGRTKDSVLQVEAEVVVAGETDEEGQLAGQRRQHHHHRHQGLTAIPRRDIRHRHRLLLPREQQTLRILLHQLLHLPPLRAVGILVADVNHNHKRNRQRHRHRHPPLINMVKFLRIDGRNLM